MAWGAPGAAGDPGPGPDVSSNTTIASLVAKMAVDLWRQIIGRPEGVQLDLPLEHGLMLNMGNRVSPIALLGLQLSMERR